MTDPTPVNFKHEPRTVGEFVVLDLDRTLINTSFVTRLVLARLTDHGVSTDRITAAHAYVEAQSGNSFYLFEYIKIKFSEHVLDEIVKDIMADDASLEEMRQELLCSGANTLIDALEAQDIPCMILTFGEVNYQNFKIALFRRLTGKSAEKLPAIVTDTANKSEWVTDAWFAGEDKLGEVPAEIMGEALRVRSVVVVDDKSVNLQSTDDRVRGVLVDNSPYPKEGVASTAEVADAAASGVRLTEIAHLYEKHEQRAS